MCRTVSSGGRLVVGGGVEGNFYGNEIGELSGVYKWGAGWTRQGTTGRIMSLTLDVTLSPSQQ